MEWCWNDKINKSIIEKNYWLTINTTEGRIYSYISDALYSSLSFKLAFVGMLRKLVTTWPDIPTLTSSGIKPSVFRTSLLFNFPTATFIPARGSRWLVCLSVVEDNIMPVFMSVVADRIILVSLSVVADSIILVVRITVSYFVICRKSSNI